jgi:hypothetical protein
MHIPRPNNRVTLLVLRKMAGFPGLAGLVSAFLLAAGRQHASPILQTAESNACGAAVSEVCRDFDQGVQLDLLASRRTNEIMRMFTANTLLYWRPLLENPGDRGDSEYSMPIEFPAAALAVVLGLLLAARIRYKAKVRSTGLRSMPFSQPLAVSPTGMTRLPAAPQQPGVEHLCPRCRSHEIRPSRSRRSLDFVWTFAGYQAFRCRHCGRRFFHMGGLD